ncbi:MAG: 5-(carboxyamino)imidazole ribonucleotide synthase [Bacteroidales bacterium]
MERLVTSNLKLGIIAGGQLGKMLIQEASKWDIATYVLDKTEECPAAAIANHFVLGSHLDFDAVYNFGKLVDVLTFEIESVNVEALKKLKEEGVRIEPDPLILEHIQDKGLQKQFYSDHDIPTVPYKLYESAEKIKNDLSAGTLNYPFVQKLRKGGYDGRGVAILNSEEDLPKLLEGPSVVEEKVEIDKEIAVVAARNKKGEVRCHPTVEMVFDEKANLVEKLICPSTVSEVLARKAENIAADLIEKLDMSGLLAVEFFVDMEGKVIVNEVAPRPHNSGHHTIESIITSQFEQHLRAILNLPLGSTQIKMASVMLNLLGEEGHEGRVMYEGLTESMAIEGVKIHLYGKKLTQPYRKMGHVTVLSHVLEDAIRKADQIKKKIKVKSWTKN